MAGEKIQVKLDRLGLALPAVAKPVAAYTPARRAGSLVFISGQLPLEDGKLLLTGPMQPGPASGHSIEASQAAMARCFLNGLAAAGLVCDPDEIDGVVKLSAFVACTPDFTEHHLVANGASELAQKIFGDAGVHARAAVGVPSLPLNATVELEIVFSLTEGAA